MTTPEHDDTMRDPTAAPLITTEHLRESLTDATAFDVTLAKWALEVVSNTARLVANRPAWTPDNVPPAVQSVVSLAARRLYTNPDRFTRESSGDYSYGLDASVTNADVFTNTEKGTLLGFRPSRKTGGLTTLSTTRGDAYAPHGHLPAGYVPDGTARGFPWYDTDGTLGGW